MRRRALAGLAAAALVALLTGAGLAPVTALAHDFHMGIADISYNERTGSTEIVHSYTAHDIEALLSQLYKRQVDLGRTDDVALLRDYMARQFYLTGTNGSRLALAWVGAHADADSVTVYQELAKTRLTAGTTLHNGVLSELMPDQKNTVNVELNGRLKTLLFARGRLDQPL
jgi:multidrug efflux pump subunit AcrB